MSDAPHPDAPASPEPAPEHATIVATTISPNPAIIAAAPAPAAQSDPKQAWRTRPPTFNTPDDSWRHEHSKRHEKLVDDDDKNKVIAKAFLPKEDAAASASPPVVDAPAAQKAESSP